MKNVWKILPAAALLGLCLGLSACGDGHTHTAATATQYAADDTSHWLVCTDCGERFDEEAHNFNGENVCTACGFVKDYTQGLEYAPVGAGYAVKGMGEATAQELILPSYYQGASVTEIALEAFSGCDTLTHVRIPGSITSIGTWAFSGCDSLENVTWGAKNCTFAGSRQAPVFDSCPMLTSVSFSKAVETIPAYAFYGCAALKDVEIGENVGKVGESAFAGCVGLHEIALPAHLTSLGAYAFEHCSGLTRVALGGLTEIASGTFYGCGMLAHVTIGGGVKKIGESAFGECIELSEIEYLGTIEAWKEIEKAPDWAPWAEYSVTCTDGSIAKDGTEQKN